PISGLTPCLRVSRYSSTAPASEPWSVSATAGISSSAARSASRGMRHAPSRIEYSEWTWRWTNGASGTDDPFQEALPTAHVDIFLQVKQISKKDKTSLVIDREKL